MLKTCGYPSLSKLIDTPVPAEIRLRRPLKLPASRGEQGLLIALRKIASQNQVFAPSSAWAITIASRRR